LALIQLLKFLLRIGHFVCKVYFARLALILHLNSLDDRSDVKLFPLYPQLESAIGVGKGGGKSLKSLLDLLLVGVLEEGDPLEILIAPIRVDPLNVTLLILIDLQM
jgi:hypothetical protein